MTEAVCDQAYCQNVVCYGCAGSDMSFCMSACMGGSCNPFQPDATGKLAQALGGGSFEVSDVRWGINRVVSFGFSASPNYAFPSAFGGACPGTTVMLSTPSFAGGADICVPTTPTADDTWLQSQATFYLSDIASDHDRADSDLPGLRNAIEVVLQSLLAAVVCRTDDHGKVAFCMHNTGAVTVAGTSLFSSSICPVPPDLGFVAGCVSRGNQTPFGCGVISCIEPLSSLPVAVCTGLTLPRVPTPDPGLNVLGAGIFCKLIHKRNHFYTEPANNGALELCSTTDSRCTRSFVMQTLLADVRRQAPFVLDGRPNGLFAAPLRSSPLPIDMSNQAKLYYLGFSFYTNTSNPITVSVPNSGFDFTATNTADQDHMLQGLVQNLIVQEGTSIKVRSIGSGTNTRFALLNELVGPKALRGVQNDLKNAVRAALQSSSSPPPPPPCQPRCGAIP